MKKRFQTKKHIHLGDSDFWMMDQCGYGRVEVEIDEKDVGGYQRRCIRFKEKPKAEAVNAVVNELPKIMRSIEYSLRYFIEANSNDMFAYSVIDRMLLKYLNEIYGTLLAVFCPHLVEEVSGTNIINSDDEDDEDY